MQRVDHTVVLGVEQPDRPPVGRELEAKRGFRHREGFAPVNFVPSAKVCFFSPTESVKVAPDKSISVAEWLYNSTNAGVSPSRLVLISLMTSGRNGSSPGVSGSGTAADGVTLRPCTDVPLTVRWSAKRKRVAGPVGAAWPRGTRFEVDLKQDGIEVVAQPESATAVGQAPGERAEDLLEAVSLFDRFRVRGDDDVTQLVNPGVGRKRKRTSPSMRKLPSSSHHGCEL